MLLIHCGLSGYVIWVFVDRSILALVALHGMGRREAFPRQASKNKERNILTPFLKFLNDFELKSSDTIVSSAKSPLSKYLIPLRPRR